jgi:hypothetical protein
MRIAVFVSKTNTGHSTPQIQLNPNRAAQRTTANPRAHRNLRFQAASMTGMTKVMGNWTSGPEIKSRIKSSNDTIIQPAGRRRTTVEKCSLVGFIVVKNTAITPRLVDCDSSQHPAGPATRKVRRGLRRPLLCLPSHLPWGEGTCDGAQLDAVPRRLLDQVAPRPTRKELVLAGAGKNRRPPAAQTKD